MIDLAQLTRRSWDAVVIGTGMGGATIGHALARAGWRVVFCEKGRSNLAASDSLRGDYPERISRTASRAVSPETLRRAGREWREMRDASTGEPRRFVPFIGSGTGGSSALYGMALERFSPADFSPGEHHRDAVGSTVPDRWPITYDELAPFYAAAERLYGVRGSPDPLRGEQASTLAPGPALSASASELAVFLGDQGLHPYRLPLACDHVPRCIGCQGFLCANECKRDSARTCLQSALVEHGASLIDECEALRLASEGAVVTGVVCHRHEAEFRIDARVVIVAAGALASPALLLRSATGEHPRGLGNSSGLVGRNLMRHFVDLYAIFPKHRPARAHNAKELGCNDFYLTPEGKFGAIQSFGLLPPGSMLVDGLREDLRHDRGRWAAAGLGVAAPLVARVLDALFARTVILATILEDLPYAHNALSVDDPQGEGLASIRYRIDDHATKRIEAFRRNMRRVLQPYRFLLLEQAHSNQRIAHACGTCRFGSDPRASVLDRNNKAHDLDNLYVVDASFFPTSGGTNPALTIAANALRVADHLVRLERSKESR